MDEGGKWRQLGGAAVARGDFAGARVAFDALLAEDDSAETHQALARVCTVLEDLDEARRHAEIAYRRYREAGDLRSAGVAAIDVAHVHEWWGQEEAVDGWLARAARLLGQSGDCVEQGYLAVARIGCDVQDVKKLEASADAALELARRFGDTDLEVRALADSGLALVSQGMIQRGLERLDEAMAAIVAGEVHSHAIAGITCCAMLHACDRLGDFERASHWTDAVLRSARDRFGEPPPVVLQGHCRLMYGSLLRELGRSVEAEAEFRRTLEFTRCLHYRADASARLALLRIGQGRLVEAEELLEGFADRVEAAEAIARLHLARHELDLAAATLRRALRGLADNLLSRAPLLRILVEVEIGRADLGAAGSATKELRDAAEASGMPGVWALFELCDGRLAAAAGLDPTQHLCEALARLADGQRPLLRAEIQLELAAAQQERHPAAAVAEARAALATFERFGIRQDADRASSILRALGVRVRSGRPAADGTTAGTPLSPREREVLELLVEGLSNPEIARRLFITARTAEHHVGAILGKLNLRSRTEAALYGASRRAVGVG